MPATDALQPTAELLRANTAELADVLTRLNELGPLVEQGAKLLQEALTRGGKVMACGNGGSASQAIHFAAEFVCRLKDDRRGLPAIALSASASDLTAIANDYGYDRVFSRQLEALANPGDALLAISTSGNSANVVQALEMAKQMNVATVAMLGKDGGACKGLADIELIVPSDTTARIQECHELLLHTLCQVAEAPFMQQG